MKHRFTGAGTVLVALLAVACFCIIIANPPAQAGPETAVAAALPQGGFQ